jgi:hypothetical protein
MKSSPLVLSLVAVFALTGGSVFAGSSGTVHINIPFDFYAGEQQLAAGKYIIEMNTFPSTVAFRSEDQKGICFLLAHPQTQTSFSNMLQFNRYGNKLFLSSISVRGIRTGFSMHKLEKELKMQAAEERQNVAIALR